MHPLTSPPDTQPEAIPDRRLILVCGILLLASLGSVYAWSFFTKPLCDAYGWSKMEVSAVFSLAVAGLGLSAAYTGPLVSKLGSRRLVYRSSAFFAGGYLVAALALQLRSLPLLCIGYGVIGGIGLGTGYVTGVTTIAGWFPDRKGFATGLVVMGFGIGALLMSKVIAPLAMEATGNSLPITFLIIGIAFSVIMPLASRGIHSPPSTTTSGKALSVAETIQHGPNVQVRLWLVCFLYSLAGLGIISLQSVLMQKVAGEADPTLTKVALASIGATLIGWTSVGNSVGRLFWASISDKIGRINTFIALLSTASAAFLILPHVTSPLVYGALLAYTIASYGGGFGTIPSLISDLYGPKRMSAVHGKILTGWASAGLIAPPAFGYLMDKYPNQAAQYAFYSCAAVLFLACLLAATFKELHLKTTGAPATDRAADDPE
jgi:OFA family oxalate/formate antiporter-like MFS transporter